MELRKLKVKKEKKKSRSLGNLKNFILRESCIRDMQERLDEELGKACVLIGLAAIYIRNHRKAWDMDDSYLKPYLKGLLTKIANNFDEFSKDRLKEGFLERNFEILNQNVSEGIIYGTQKIKDRVVYERDYRIFEPFIFGSVCVGAVKEKLNFIAKYDKEMADNIKVIFKDYDKYLKFWATEIDTFNINFQ